MQVDTMPIEHLECVDTGRSRFALVDHDGATSLRNDRSVVRSVEKNKWYVLATVCGEQGDFPDPEDHRQNRRIWNGWMCARMSAEDRQAAAKILGLPAAELEPLDDAELEQVARAFAQRIGPEAEPPEPGTVARFRESRFERALICDGFWFHAADFRGCHFESHANFQGAAFSAGARFSFVHFQRAADFSGAVFGDGADFSLSWFAEHDGASFSRACFDGAADFMLCCFLADVGFNDAVFRGGASFQRAEFRRSVPEFFHCQQHQATAFTAEPPYWPEVTPSNGVQGKAAYTRLRQMMNDLAKVDEEYFFYRQEMRCKAAIEHWPDNWVIKGFGGLSDFGFSITRPLLALFAMWCVPAIVYLGHYAPAIMDGSVEMSPLGPFGLSFGFLFSFFGFPKLFFEPVVDGMGPVLTLLAGVQTIMGFVLLFLLGLGLRNRFRLK